MSAISLKSITGITSITTPAGVDNQLTLHNNNTTEAVKLDIAGNLHFHNHLNITGVSTASNFKTGTSNLHNTGLNVQDLDVDGHTNLDNVSISGITTSDSDIDLISNDAQLLLEYPGRTKGHLTANYYNRIMLSSNSPNTDIVFGYTQYGGDSSSFANPPIPVVTVDNGDKSLKVGTGVTIESNGQATFVGVSTFSDIDVDGHTNLDNVSIAGVTTASDNIIIPDDKKLILGSVSGRQLHLYHNMVGSSNHVIESTSSSNHLIIKATTINPRSNYFSFRNYAHNQDVFIVDADGQTKLFFNGNTKLETTNTGAIVSGILTATSFSGTASGNTTISNNADNRVITGGSGNALNGESALTFDGNTLTVSAPSNDTPLIVDTASTNGAHLRFQKDGSNQHFVGAGGGFSLGDKEDLSLRAYDNLLFATGNTSTERLRITSGGSVNIGGDYTQTSSKLKVTGTVTVDGGFALSAGSFTAPGGFSINSGNVIISGSIAHDADSDTLFGFGSGADTFSIQTAGTRGVYVDSSQRTSISKNGWTGSDMSFGLTVHTGSTSDGGNAVNDGIMIVSQNNNGNQNSTTGKLMFCGHAQTNGPFIYGKNAQAYGKKDLVFNTRSTANSYSQQLEETARLTYYGALRVNKIEPRDGLDTNAFGGVIQVKWSANVDNANYSSTSDVVMQTVTITPTSNDARMLIHVVYPSIRTYVTGNTRTRLNQHIKRDGNEIYNLNEMPQWRSANFGSSGVEVNKNVAFTHIDNPSTTNQITYTATWQSVDGHVWNTSSGQMVMIVAELTGY